VAKLAVEADPAELGLDPGRLARIDRHFQAYVDDGRLPGYLLAVTRGGCIAYVASYGRRDVEAGSPVEDDTIYRIYSMTKPITSVAAMMLYEEGAFALKDPVADYIGAFADQRVYTRGNPFLPATAPATEPVRIWHLLTHTSGLTYGFHYANPVDAMYRNAGFELGTPPGMDLAGAVDAWASMPLLFNPGEEWNYSVSTDVLGRLVEVVSGQSLDRVFAERIFGPLGMADTGFSIPEADHERQAALYWATPANQLQRADAARDEVRTPPALLSGGGGLAGTAYDYHRFTQMLLNGGELDGVRLLSDRTVDYMTINHLPGDADIEEFGRPLFPEDTYEGVGFGLGFSVVIDPAATKTLGSPGLFAWGGAASTAFWVDPLEELTTLFFTQVIPSNQYPIRTELQQLVYQALVD